MRIKLPAFSRAWALSLLPCLQSFVVATDFVGRPDLISGVCKRSFSSFIIFSFFFVSSEAAWRRSPPSAQ
jgi:hypothetical protein